MSAQHTPGPWCVSKDAEGLGVVSVIDGIRYWITGAIEHAGPESAPETKESNARLIAAAPELLDSLQALADAVSMPALPEYVNACAAIAKATGVAP